MFYQQKKIYRQSHNTSNLPEDQNLHMNISHDSNPPNIKTQTRIDENQEKPKKQKRHEKENSSFNQKQFEKKGANNPSKNNWEYVRLAFFSSFILFRTNMMKIKTPIHQMQIVAIKKVGNRKIKIQENQIDSFILFVKNKRNMRKRNQITRIIKRIKNKVGLAELRQ